MAFSRFLRQLGKNIKAARARSGLKQVDVSAASGLLYRHYQNIEAGRVNVTVETLFRLSKLYKTSVAELVRDGG
jgi:transcriptional regulator with XRE-family HTH domain